MFRRYPHIKITIDESNAARYLVPGCKRRKKLLTRFDSGVRTVAQDAIEESACLLVNSDAQKFCGVEELETGTSRGQVQ